MKSIIRSIDVPTDLYILGCAFNKTLPTISIMDDYCEVEVRQYYTPSTVVPILSSVSPLSTVGYLFIFTEDELMSNLMNIDELFIDLDGIKIMNFTGSIYVDIHDSDGFSVLQGELDFSTDYLHQMIHGYVKYPLSFIIEVHHSSDPNESEVSDCECLLGLCQDSDFYS